MCASPTNRELMGTDSLLGGGPQRSASVFCSLSFCLFWFIHFLIPKQHRSTFLIAIRAESCSAGIQEYSSESLAKKWWSMEKLWIRSASCLVYNGNRSGPSTDPCGTLQRRGFSEEIDHVVQVNIGMESVQEQGLVYRINCSTEVQEDKKGIISTSNHRQKITDFVEECCLSAVYASIRGYCQECFIFSPLSMIITNISLLPP